MKLKYPLIIATVVTIATFFWHAVDLDRVRGDLRLVNSKGTVKARDFSLQILAYPLAHSKESEAMAGGQQGYVNLEQLKGKAVMINFWASWCQSCSLEAPLVEAIWKRYGQKLVVIGVVLQDDPDAAVAFAKQTGKSYLIAYDPDGTMSIDYGITGVPETLFIDSQSFVYTKVTGPLETSQAEQIITAMLPQIAL